MLAALQELKASAGAAARKSLNRALLLAATAVWGVRAAHFAALRPAPPQPPLLPALPQVPPSCITTNRCCLDCVPIPVAVRLREAAGPGGARRQRRVAILLRDPLRQLMRGSGAALGAGEAQALLLKVSGGQERRSSGTAGPDRVRPWSGRRPPFRLNHCHHHHHHCPCGRRRAGT